MIAVDTNLLVQAHQREASLHQESRNAVRKLAEGAVPWGICFHSLVEFYAVVTHPRLWRKPSTPVQAFDQVAAWQESPSLRVLMDNEPMLEQLKELCVKARVAGGKVHDARIAACCLAHGVHVLWTVDRDFSRFPALKVVNPVAG